LIIFSEGSFKREEILQLSVSHVHELFDELNDRVQKQNDAMKKASGKKSVTY